MNTALKVTLIIAIVLVVAGLIIMTVALVVSKFNLQKLIAPTLTDSSVPVSGEFTSISIKSDSATVSIARSTDGLCRVDFTDFDDDSITHTVEISNGVLNVVRHDASMTRGYISLGTGPSMTVFLPAEVYDELEIETSSGDINVPGGISFDELDVSTTSGGIAVSDTDVTDELDAETSSGGIRLQGVSARKLAAQCSSGGLHLDKISCDDAELKTSSGSIRLQGVSAHKLSAQCLSGGLHLDNITCDVAALKTSSGSIRASSLELSGTLQATCMSGGMHLEAVRCSNFEADSSSGSVRLTDLVATGSIDIKTTSGGITLDRCDAATLELEASSGSVRGSLLTPKVYVVTTSSGIVRVPEQMSGGMCRVRTLSGSVKFE